MELLPCPLCGHRASLLQTDDGLYSVICSEPECECSVDGWGEPTEFNDGTASYKAKAFTGEGKLAIVDAVKRILEKNTKLMTELEHAAIYLESIAMVYQSGEAQRDADTIRRALAGIKGE